MGQMSERSGPAQLIFSLQGASAHLLGSPVCWPVPGRGSTCFSACKPGGLSSLNCVRIIGESCQIKCNLPQNFAGQLQVPPPAPHYPAASPDNRAHPQALRLLAAQGTPQDSQFVGSQRKIITPVIQGILKGDRPLEQAFGTFPLGEKYAPSPRRGQKSRPGKGAERRKTFCSDPTSLHSAAIANN